MKKYLSIIILAVLALSLYTYYDISIEDLSDFSSITGAATGLPEPEVVEETIETNEVIQVTFCPTENCEETLVNFINEAQTTLHCAFYDIGLESVQEALRSQAEKIEVQVVTDDHYYDKFPEDFVIQDGYAYMHNKFCISDNQKVLTGSMNPTDNGANKNDNNLLIIKSESLANNFETEFQELWSGTFKKGDPNALTINLNDITIESYFCPDDDCATAVEEEIAEAENSIYFMTFSFTHEGIANNILLKYTEGLGIKGVFESRMNSEYSKFDVFDYQGIEVKKDGNSNSMHHKVFIIDEETVITGSMNPSNNGVDGNDETLLIIHSTDIANEFIHEFNRVWTEAEE